MRTMNCLLLAGVGLLTGSAQRTSEVILGAEPGQRGRVGADPQHAVLEPPGRNQKPVIGQESAILVNGRRVTPAGRVILTQSYNWGMAVSADETQVALVNRDAVEVVRLEPELVSRRYPPYGQEVPTGAGTGQYMGCAFSRDGRQLFYGSANEGQIKILDLASGDVVGSIETNDDTWRDSFIGEFVASADGKRLYAVDQHNYRMLTVEVASRRVVQSVPVGRNPFAVSLSGGGQFAWVSNVGLFEYPLIAGVTPNNRSEAGLTFPAYGVPSKEAEAGTMAEGKWIPGLGSPNHPDAMSVFKVNLGTGKVERKIKTGYLVGVERDNIRTVGGASPGSLVVGRRWIYVANATNDSISIIDAQSGEVVGHINLVVPRLERLRGVLPFGLCLSPDEQRLYAACAGLNAVAVMDLPSRSFLGYIPAGWFCAFVECSQDGRTLFIASAKGLGSGPNGGQGFVAPIRGTHPGDIMRGTLQVVPVPDPDQLSRYTQQVIANTYQIVAVKDDPAHPVPPVAGLRQSPIRHLVFVVKENRTFDQVYGQRAGVEGDPTLAELGLKRTITSDKGDRRLEQVDISPNHHGLADRFAISDNFYCDSDQSNTGHRWVVGVYPNEWVEVNARSRIEERLFSTAPGRRYVSGSSGVVNPEDYNEAGALWEHLARYRIPFFNFGFGTEMPASIENQLQKFTGVRMSVSFPLPKPLFDHTSRKYATYNMAIPDQFRLDMFEEEFRDKWESGREPFPRLLTLVLPNDHLTGEHPEDGYPFGESYMADNDLALGRLVQKLSGTTYWKNMLIIVTEDDPQGGRDHVEAHRSILLMIGPHVKKGYVSHTLASFGSIMKLIFTVLDIPYLNHFDAAATLPLDFFADQADTTPYRVRTLDKRLFDPDQAFKPFDRRFNWKNLLGSPEMDRLEDMRKAFDHDRP